SSVAAVGRAAPGSIADEDTRYDWPPGLAYNETKRDAERLVRRCDGLETICLNPALVFGPGEVYRRTLTLFRVIKYGLLPFVPPRRSATAHAGTPRRVGYSATLCAWVSRRSYFLSAR